jgi:hypothetical protein
MSILMRSGFMSTMLAVAAPGGHPPSVGHLSPIPHRSARLSVILVPWRPWPRGTGRSIRVSPDGYHIRAALQGRGLATEAAAACRDYARDVLGVNRLIASIDPHN